MVDFRGEQCFGYELTRLLLDKGDTVIGTVRNKAKISDLIAEYPTLFDCQILDVTDEQVDLIIATNLTGSIQMIRSALPFLRKQGHGRIIQISSYGGQVAFPGNSMYHATKFGIEGLMATRRTAFL